MLTPEPVTTENFERIIALELDAQQRGFVQSNLYSIAQSYVRPEFHPTAICLNGEPVGFLLWCIDPEEDQYWVYRLMIDRAHQRRGYGTAALRLLVEQLRQDPSRGVLYISAFPENTAALAAYAGLGFVPDGRKIAGEVVLKYIYRGEKI